MNGCTILIPALNPDGRLPELLGQLNDLGFRRIILVDDGSSMAFRPVFDSAREQGCVVCHHYVNKGKGEAIKTGIRKLQKVFPDSPAVITCDADGQHTPEDIAHIAQTAAGLENTVTLGTRDFHSPQVPARSRFGNGISSLLFRLSTGASCCDTQTGLRCIPAKLFPLALQTAGSRYEYEMNFLLDAARQGTELQCVPIRTIYETSNRSSHFRPVRDSLRVFCTPLRFASASLFCALVDLVLFTLFSALLKSLPARIAFATAAARLCSGALNFTLNRRWSFLSHGDVRVQVMRYLILFFAQMGLSAGLVSLLSAVPVWITLIKATVDLLLFCCSYFLQRWWVFAPEKLSKG